MNTFHPYTIFPLGDAALTVEFGNVIDEEVNRKVLRLFRQLKEQKHPYILDLVPAYSSLTVYYDVLSIYQKKRNEATAFSIMADILEQLSTTTYRTPLPETRIIKVPVCYSTAFGYDLDEIAAIKKCSREEVIRLHTAKNYRVFMLGFLPGFAYMGEVDELLVMPRKEKPRLHVEAGSVGITGRQTGIYPFRSPGGWQILGRTPMKLFNPNQDQPVLFQPGDIVKFYSITEDEFADHKGRRA